MKNLRPAQICTFLETLQTKLVDEKSLKLYFLERKK